MKILIIRHGDPNYEIDNLTEKGRREAELLSERISKLDVRKFYVSPLGRAKATAAYTLEKMGRTAEECPWLREFHAPVTDEHSGEQRIPWDLLPEDWTKVDGYYSKDEWYKTPIMSGGNVIAEAQRVYDGLDKILAENGYVREGNFYRAEKSNNDTIVLFCHFGVECVMLGHLLGISPVLLWHGFCAAPTSVTTLVSEERRKGIAYFRAGSFGDTAHLYANGEPAAFAGRFCECFDNQDERHD
ncbi:MAG: histidine phosphatase family protein [Oscillospiraceae bacterium]